MDNFIRDKTLGFFVKTKGIFSKRILGGQGHIFMLHRVLPEDQRKEYVFNKDLAITPEYLEECINYFYKKDYDFISLDELYQIVTKKKKLNKKFVVFTLDDGYRDNIEFGKPVFEKYNIPFTIYVTTCFPDNNAVLWWYLLENKINETDTLLFPTNEGDQQFSWTNKAEAATCYSELSGLIKNLPKENFRHSVKSILQIENQNITELCVKNALTWEEIKVASDHPLITIGAHSLNHLPLANLTENEAFEEMMESKRIIENKIQKKVEHFAYPYGGLSDANQREYFLAKKTGFKTATINYPGNIFYSSSQHTECLPRMPLGNTTTLEKLENIINGITHFGANGFNKYIKHENQQ
ncbi:MAG: polysaccharide deacetylase family protein [Crocinitomicaceae bacterium]|nr:polysaccharide deacetylase family protein [Crocinitomicaceae bacterium]